MRGRLDALEEEHRVVERHVNVVAIECAESHLGICACEVWRDEEALSVQDHFHYPVG